MISVVMLSQGGKPVGFEASGHAGFGSHGEDIVCSAVSAVTQCVVLGLKERLQLPMALQIDENDGIYCVLGKECTDRQWSEAEILLDTLRLGLKSIEEEYGEYLSIQEREV